LGDGDVVAEALAAGSGRDDGDIVAVEDSVDGARLVGEQREHRAVQQRCGKRGVQFVVEPSMSSETLGELLDVDELPAVDGRPFQLVYEQIYVHVWLVPIQQVAFYVHEFGVQVLLLDEAHDCVDEFGSVTRVLADAAEADDEGLVAVDATDFSGGYVELVS